MGDAEPRLSIKLHGSIAAIGEAAWDACAGDDNPFVSWRFLNALEESGSVSARTGWAPQHLTVEDDTGQVIGCAPMYLKGHSQGEYVFDHGWAQAFEQAGGRYYPKLLIAVPFSPVPGPRLLTHRDLRREDVLPLVITGATEAAKQLKVSSLHINFPPEDEWTFLGEHGFLQRTGEQFHWANDGYKTFDDFLAALSSRKRKAIRKEREGAVENGIALHVFTGDAIAEEHWDAFFAFYLDTGSRKWGRPYLNRKFFSLLGQAMAEQVVLVFAYRGRTPIAGALNLVGPNCLYGRYWGCTEYHPALHFEVCYYQAIDYAIAHKLARVEAGAQGPHKLARGYLPARTYSAHYLADPALRRAVEQYLVKERAYVETEMRELGEHSPFRQMQDEQD